MKESYQPPKKGGGTGYIAAAVLMLFAAGGLVAYKMMSQPAEAPVPPSEAATATQQNVDAGPELQMVPPPPEEPSADASAEPAPGGSGVARVAGAAGCSGECRGSASATLQAALRARGGAARRCYDRALMNNAALTGKMTVSLRLGQGGTVCSANIGADTLDDNAIRNCVLQVFRSGKFPAPDGNCVMVDVPLNFVQQR